MKKISLEKFEVYVAASVGIKRRIESSNVCGKLTDRLFNPHLGCGWDTDIEAACSEMATAKLFGIYWNGSVGTFKEADLGKDIQIRHTVRDDGCLIVRANDKDDEIYLLTTGKCPIYSVHGWILGADAKNERFLKDPNGRGAAWFVPQHELKDIQTLKIKKNNSL